MCWWNYYSHFFISETLHINYLQNCKQNWQSLLKKRCSTSKHLSKHFLLLNHPGWMKVLRKFFINWLIKYVIFTHRRQLGQLSDTGQKFKGFQSVDDCYKELVLVYFVFPVDSLQSLDTNGILSNINVGVLIPSIAKAIWNQASRHAHCFYKHLQKNGLISVILCYGTWSRC